MIFVIPLFAFIFFMLITKSVILALLNTTFSRSVQGVLITGYMVQCITLLILGIDKLFPALGV